MTPRRMALLATACAAAFARYLTWPCRIPTPWPMFVAGKLCRTFPVRARPVASGVSPIPAGAPNRSAFVRSGAELEAFRAQWAIAVPPPDWNRESLLFIASPGADSPPAVERVYQWWDARGTVVAVLSQAPGPRGQRAAAGWPSRSTGARSGASRRRPGPSCAIGRGSRIQITAQRARRDHLTTSVEFTL